MYNRYSLQISSRLSIFVSFWLTNLSKFKPWLTNWFSTTVTAHHFITHPVHHQMQFVITELNSTLITYSLTNCYTATEAAANASLVRSIPDCRSWFFQHGMSAVPDFPHCMAVAWKRVCECTPHFLHVPASVTQQLCSQHHGLVHNTGNKLVITPYLLQQ